MNSDQQTPETIDAYMAGFPEAVRLVLDQVRATIHAAAPDATESISYKMPTFNLAGHYLVYFAAFKNHLSFFGAPRDNPAFGEDLRPYESGQGTLKFPYNKPIPYDLIAKITQFRANENRERAAAKGGKNQGPSPA